MKSVLTCAFITCSLSLLLACSTQRSERGKADPNLLAPDLIISKVIGPASGTGTVNQSISVTDTNKNIGNLLAGTSRTGIYICSDTNNVYGGVLLAAHDVGSIAAGASRGTTITASVPANSPTGDVFLSVVADDSHVLTRPRLLVAESNENNNTNSIPIHINP